MIKNQGTDKDELEYVGLIKDCIRYKDDVRAINVFINNLISYRFGSAKA
jgi:hypothetical protein